jgi:hypothetical protein
VSETPETKDRVHELKTWPEYFEDVWEGRKTFEVRENDRNFQVGDVLRLREFEPVGSVYSGRELRCRVSYMTDYGQKPYHVVMALAVEAGEASKQDTSNAVSERKAESPSVSALLTLQEGLKEMEAKCRRRAAFSYNVADRIRNPVADRTEADVLRQGADVALSCADELSALLSSLVVGQDTK